jgi:DtxR family Mn-dependent transcriptional regulator
MLSYTEENYLKALLKLSFQNEDKPEAGTNELGYFFGVNPSTQTYMIKNLK